MPKPNFPFIQILLGEDDPDDSMLFQLAIDEANIASIIRLAENGDQLVKCLNVDSFSVPDLIFLDLNMPKKDGLECLKEIRSSIEYDDVPVIMYSTSNNKTEIENCFENGADYYVVKPYLFDDIKKMIIDFCSRDWNLKLPRDRRSFVVSYGD